MAGTTVPDLEALVLHGALPPLFRDYLLSFTEAVRNSQRVQGAREGSFCDLWMGEEQADQRRNWAATEAARAAVAAAAAPRL